MKKRLDILVSEQEGISRAKAQALIMAGEVLVEGKPESKAGSEFAETVKVTVKEKFPYVSRGALKLKKAYEDFELDFKGKIICDVGASTGGFTDFALSVGAKKVYAIDTGKGQIAQKLREDRRVVLLENTNIKEVESLPEPIEFFVIDVSFISLKKVLPVIQKIIQNTKYNIQKSLRGAAGDAAIWQKNRYASGRDDKSVSVIALIKPQFEVGKEVADKTKGIIKDSVIQMKVVEEIGRFAESIGLKVEGLTDSPIQGAKGNVEYLIYLS